MKLLTRNKEPIWDAAKMAATLIKKIQVKQIVIRQIDKEGDMDALVAGAEAFIQVVDAADVFVGSQLELFQLWLCS